MFCLLKAYFVNWSVSKESSKERNRIRELVEEKDLLEISSLPCKGSIQWIFDKSIRVRGLQDFSAFLHIFVDGIYCRNPREAGIIKTRAGVIILGFYSTSRSFLLSQINRNRILKHCNTIINLFHILGRNGD